MSVFNPWAEVRKLKAQLEAGYETYRVEETQQQAEWAKKEVRLHKLERDNADLRYALEQANANLRRERQTLHARILDLLNKLDNAVDPRDPKTGRFTKKAK
jgi:uncharacterized membrane protein YqiK